MSPERRHGGPRPNSGRKSLYPGKVRRPVSVVLTPDGHRLLADASNRLQLSVSDVVEALVRGHAEALAAAPPPRPRPSSTPPRAARHRTADVQFLSRHSPSDIKGRLTDFTHRYKQDWQRWVQVCKGRRLDDSEVVRELKRTLGRWQAVRPRPLASEAGLTALIRRAATPIEQLGECTLRDLPYASATQREALLELWDLFSRSLAGNGETGCVGITKGVMLLTKGRIGPALDSRVRGELGLRQGPKDGPEWLSVLDAIARDLRGFERTNRVKLEELVEPQCGPIAVGRVYDMVAGPRPQ